MRVLETVLYAEDLTTAHKFYTGVLALEVISFNVERSLFLRCEQSVLIIFKASKTLVHDSNVPPHGTTGPGHLAFAATEEEIESWRITLTDHSIEIIDEVHWENGAHSIYFKDPANNVLEFATPKL